MKSGKSDKQMRNTKRISHEPVLYKAHQTQYDKVNFLSNEEVNRHAAEEESRRTCCK